MQRLVFSRDFSLPTDQVFEYFAEPENLGPLFGVRVTGLRDGDDGSRNGAGSVRRVKVGPAPAFEETITEFVPDELIEYRITKGSPLKEHVGEIRFSPSAAGTHLEWTISFSNPIPGFEVVIAKVLHARIAKGLAEADLTP